MTNAFTVEAWIKLIASNDGVTPLFSGSHADTNYFGFSIVSENNESKLRGTLTTTEGALAIEGGSIAINQWRHIALTYDATTSQALLFLDGMLIASNEFSGSLPSGNVDFVLGGTGSGFNPYLIDEISLYTRALPLEEIDQIITAGSEGKCKLPDLVVSADIPASISAGTNVTWSVTVTNRGIGTALNAGLYLSIPLDVCDVADVIATSGGFIMGDCSIARNSDHCVRGGFTFDLGRMPGTIETIRFGSSKSASVKMNFFGTGTFKSTATTWSSDGDANLSDNTNTLETIVGGAPEIRMSRWGDRLEVFWANQSHRFFLEENTLDGSSWSPSSNDVSSGNYRATVITNMPTSQSKIFRLRDSGTAASDCISPYDNLPYSMYP